MWRSYLAVVRVAIVVYKCENWIQRVSDNESALGIDDFVTIELDNSHPLVKVQSRLFDILINTDEIRKENGD